MGSALTKVTEALFRPAMGHIATSTDMDALLSGAKSAIDSGEQFMRLAAENIARAADLGATQRQIAKAVGKSASYVNVLLKWRSAGFPETAFGPQSRQKRLSGARSAAGLVQATKQATALSTPEKQTFYDKYVGTKFAERYDGKAGSYTFRELVDESPQDVLNSYAAEYEARQTREAKRIKSEAKNPAKALEHAREEAQRDAMEDERDQAKADCRQAGDTWSDESDQWEADWIEDNWIDQGFEAEFIAEFTATWLKDHGTEYPLPLPSFEAAPAPSIVPEKTVVEPIEMTPELHAALIRLRDADIKVEKVPAIKFGARGLDTYHRMDLRSAKIERTYAAEALLKVLNPDLKRRARDDSGQWLSPKSK